MKNINKLHVYIGLGSDVLRRLDKFGADNNLIDSMKNTLKYFYMVDVNTYIIHNDTYMLISIDDSGDLYTNISQSAKFQKCINYIQQMTNNFFINEKIGYI